MRLPDSARSRLKSPLGVLLKEHAADRGHVLEHVGGVRCVVTVGDRTTEKMMEFGLVPSLQIVDCAERRQDRKPPDLPEGAVEIAVRNPASEITPEGMAAVRRAFLLRPPVRITVDGEEDLLVIPACIHAPEGSVVMYGQPGEGLVIVRVTPEIRNKAQAILDLME